MKTDWPPLGALELVEWTDSNGEHGWQGFKSWDPLECDLACKSVGWVLHEDGQRLSLTMGASATGSIDNVLTIPKFAITKRTLLRLPE